MGWKHQLVILPNYQPWTTRSKESRATKLQEFETRIPPGCARGAFFGHVQGRIPGFQECSMGLGSVYLHLPHKFEANVTVNIPMYFVHLGMMSNKKWYWTYCWWFRNPAPYVIIIYYHPIIFTRFINPRWLAGFLPSPVRLGVFFVHFLPQTLRNHPIWLATASVTLDIWWVVGPENLVNSTGSYPQKWYQQQKHTVDGSEIWLTTWDL